MVTRTQAAAMPTGGRYLAAPPRSRARYDLLKAVEFRYQRVHRVAQREAYRMNGDMYVNNPRAGRLYDAADRLQQAAQWMRDNWATRAGEKS
jgi:hypothetical protein